MALSINGLDWRSNQPVKMGQMWGTDYGNVCDKSYNFDSTDALVVPTGALQWPTGVLEWPKGALEWPRVAYGCTRVAYGCTRVAYRCTRVA